MEPNFPKYVHMSLASQLLYARINPELLEKQYYSVIINNSTRYQGTIMAVLAICIFIVTTYNTYYDPIKVKQYHWRNSLLQNYYAA
jgi:hypothetical protein